MSRLNADILVYPPKGELAMFTPKGKFGWYELMTRDTKAAG